MPKFVNFLAWNELLFSKALKSKELLVFNNPSHSCSSIYHHLKRKVLYRSIWYHKVNKLFDNCSQIKAKYSVRSGVGGKVHMSHLIRLSYIKWLLYLVVSCLLLKEVSCLNCHVYHFLNCVYRIKSISDLVLEVIGKLGEIWEIHEYSETDVRCKFIYIVIFRPKIVKGLD